MEQHEENIGTKKDLCFYRLQTAKANLKSAKILLAADEYKSADPNYFVVLHLYFYQNFSLSLLYKPVTARDSGYPVGLPGEILYGACFRSHKPGIFQPILLTA